MCEPFIKYIGGKTQILGELLKHVPEHFEAYHEPMVGGGALFWALCRAGLLAGKRVHLSDTNPALIACYNAIRTDPERLIKSLEVFKDVYEREDAGDLYYRIREAWNEGYTTPARFIFLKQTSFNGLWRHNKSGKLNMSWGKYERPKILDADRIRACSQALQSVDVWEGGFASSAKMIQPNDLVFYDPPYWGRFDLYGPDGFSKAQHLQLVQICAGLTSNRTTVIYTNEHSPEMREMLDNHWSRAEVHLAGSRRYINRDGKGREPVDDMIVVGPATARERFQPGVQESLSFS